MLGKYTGNQASQYVIRDNPIYVATEFKPNILPLEGIARLIASLINIFFYIISLHIA